jgi:hypothetical protein
MVAKKDQMRAQGLELMKLALRKGLVSSAWLWFESLADL